MDTRSTPAAMQEETRRLPCHASAPTTAREHSLRGRSPPCPPRRSPLALELLDPGFARHPDDSELACSFGQTCLVSVDGELALFFLDPFGFLVSRRNWSATFQLMRHRRIVG